MDDPNYPIFDMSEYDPNFGMEQGGSIPAPMPEEPATTQVASEGSGTVAAVGQRPRPLKDRELPPYGKILMRSRRPALMVKR